MSDTTAFPFSSNGFVGEKKFVSQSAARTQTPAQQRGVGQKVRDLFSRFLRVEQFPSTARLSDHLRRDIALDHADIAGPSASGLDSDGGASLWIIHRKRWLS